MKIYQSDANVLIFNRHPMLTNISCICIPQVHSVGGTVPCCQSSPIKPIKSIKGPTAACDTVYQITPTVEKSLASAITRRTYIRPRNSIPLK